MAERKSFLIRIDPKLWVELETWAAEELRSVNGQIEYCSSRRCSSEKAPRRRPQAKPAGKTRDKRCGE